MTNSALNLSERQQAVLQTVIEINKEGHQPYTWQVVRRMESKGHQITEKQCAYDLGVIIRTKGTGVFSAKFDSNPKVWIYEEPKGAA
ncbi:hypothetical protein ACY2LX_003592 [Acinetobacter baumannii]|uniref:Uncharacterized protein n=1 Tax=Acinetobacter baumannii TaxID=470 RepID=A0AAD2YRG4_ACIBA|nr:hypothetical protein [Acinetobacter baumannii]EHZ6835536.1 hypothetical protein [Acinetobacter baumannii]EHZ8848025.1 hypothetical protein [Acinetobacter baumannii]EIJ5840391.1 hypothetical protein [Acinetobacter baumannii]EIT1517798.1 hypothetical protein [Acinetobacter baumannii]EIT1736137.1 hypothetical protein [Acinetobacter baumannii]